MSADGAPDILARLRRWRPARWAVVAAAITLVATVVPQYLAVGAATATTAGALLLHWRTAGPLRAIRRRLGEAAFMVALSCGLFFSGLVPASLFSWAPAGQHAFTTFAFAAVPLGVICVEPRGLARLAGIALIVVVAILGLALVGLEGRDGSRAYDGWLWILGALGSTLLLVRAARSLHYETWFLKSGHRQSGRATVVEYEIAYPSRGERFQRREAERMAAEKILREVEQREIDEESRQHRARRPF